jgi:hypothetical protein
MPARIITIVMTIIISSSVKAATPSLRRLDKMGRRAFREPNAVMEKVLMRNLPAGVFRSVDRHGLGLRINIEDIMPTPAAGIRIVLHGA